MHHQGLRARVRGLPAVHLTLDGCNQAFSLGDSLILQQWRYYDHSSKKLSLSLRAAREVPRAPGGSQHSQDTAG